MKRPEAASAAARESLRVSAWLVGLRAGMAVLGSVLAAHRAGSLAVQALVAEWGAGRLGVAWSDPSAPEETVARSARRALVGAGLGLGTALVVLVFAGVTRAATFSRWTVAPAGLLVGALVAAFTAVRDELLLRGLVLRAFRHTLGAPLRLLVCGAVAAADRIASTPDVPLVDHFRSPGQLVSLCIAGLLGVSFGVAWLREKGAFLPCGSHAAWTFATTTLVSGGVCDAAWRTGIWGGSELDQSLACAVALAAIAAAVARVRPRAEQDDGSTIRA